MLHYKSFLPHYLDGENIDRHSTVMDYAIKNIHDRVSVLGGVLSLTCPILIEKSQTGVASEDGTAITVYINVGEPLRRVTISGDVSEVLDYPYENDVMSTSLEFHLDPVDEGNSVIFNPSLLVTVETYEDTTFVKGYPENDVLLGDGYDHNRLLDKLGTFLGLPRFQFVEYSVDDVALSNPPFFGKSVVDGVVQACSEDDFYYRRRLLYFVENFGVESLPILLLKLWGNWNTVLQTNLGNLICHMDVDYMDDKYMDNGNKASAEFNVLSYFFRVPNVFSVNMSVDDVGVLEERLVPFLPVTRQPLVRTSIIPVLSIDVDTLRDDVVFVGASLDNGGPLSFYPLTILVDGVVVHEQAHTDAEGIYELEIGSQGVHTVQVCSHEDAESELVCYSEELELLLSTLIEYSVVSAYWGLVELEFLVTHRSSETPLEGRVIDVTLDNTSSVGGGTSGSDGVVDALLDLGSPGWYNLHVDVPRTEEYHSTSLLIPAFEVLRHNLSSTLNKDTTDFGREDIFLTLSDNETDTPLSKWITVDWMADNEIFATLISKTDIDGTLMIIPNDGRLIRYILPGEYIIEVHREQDNRYNAYNPSVSAVTITKRDTQIGGTVYSNDGGYMSITAEVRSP